MKALELLKNQINILPEEMQSKRIKPLAKTFGTLISQMDSEVRSFAEFKEDQTNGELSNKIIIAKSLAEFFKNNKILRVDLVAESYRTQEKSKMAQFYAVKTKLLDTLRLILKESQKEAVVSSFDIYEGSFQQCENGHEIIILNGRNSNVLDHLIKEFDEYIVVSGGYDSLDAQEVDYNTEVLDRNIELCKRKNEEINGAKSGKQNKFEAVINKLEEVGKQVVAFYTYKDTLLEIGCNSKNVKIYENELSKAYVPLKKLLQKEFKIELEDICEVVVNEEEYTEDVQVESPNSWEQESNLTEGIAYSEHHVEDLLANTADADKNSIDTMRNDEIPTNNVSARDLFEQPMENNHFEEPIQNVSTNPFEVEQTPSQIFAQETPNPFEEASQPQEESNPFEQSTYSNTFETSEFQPTNNPFEQNTQETTSNSFEENQYSNPFENNAPSNPFESSTLNSNPFEQSTNPFENSSPLNNMFSDNAPKSNPFSNNPFEE